MFDYNVVQKCYGTRNCKSHFYVPNISPYNNDEMLKFLEENLKPNVAYYFYDLGKYYCVVCLPDIDVCFEDKISERWKTLITKTRYSWELNKGYFGSMLRCIIPNSPNVYQYFDCLTRDAYAEYWALEEPEDYIKLQEYQR